METSLPALRPLHTLEEEAPHPFALLLRRVLAERPREAMLDEQAIPAAVLIGLFEGPSGEPHLWLVRRPDSLRTHSGQVALPGGKKDPTDPDLVSTALREAEEEIGLLPRQVEVLGVADDLVTRTGFVITPVVGWIREPFAPLPNPSEVSRVFSAPFAAFREQGVLEPIPIAPMLGMVPIFRVDGEVVWGATAAILTALAARTPRA